MPSIIGVDIGGTQLRAARFDSDYNMLERAQQLTYAEQGTDAVLDRIYETIQQVYPESPEDLLGIGIATPGPLDARTGVIIETPNLPFENVPLRKLIREEFSCPVHIGNDADLAGLAEYTRGAGRGIRTMIYMTISTGVGGGVIIDGKPLIGGGLAGEIGHMVVDPNGPMCPCGHQGHLEATSSGPSMARRARELLAAGHDSVLREMVGDDLDRLSAKHIGKAAHDGDALAKEIVYNAGWHIGVTISALMSLLNPELFVLGGGVTNIGHLLFDPINESVAHYTVHKRYWESTPIVKAQLGDDVGLIGGAALVHAMRDEQ